MTTQRRRYRPHLTILACLLTVGASPATWSRVDAMVGPDYDRQISQQLERCKLGELMPRLRERRVDYRTDMHLGNLMWCVARFRREGLPLPDELGGDAAELAYWYLLHPDRPEQTPTERRRFQKSAVRAMGQLGDPRTLELAIALDQEKPEGLYWNLVDKISGPTRIATLEQMLPQAETRQRAKGLRLLSEEGAAGLPLIEAYLDHDEKETRRAAIDALGKSWSLPALERLKGLAADEARESTERAKAAAWVQRLDVRVRHGLCKLTQPQDERAWKLNALRFATIQGYWPHSDAELERSRRASALLLELGEEALPALREGIVSNAHGDTSIGPIWFETEMMADLMIELGEPAVPCLIDTLASFCGWCHGHAVRALVSITGQDLGQDHEPWLAWWLERAGR